MSTSTPPALAPPPVPPPAQPLAQELPPGRPRLSRRTRLNPLASRLGRRLAATSLFMVLIPSLAIALCVAYILEQNGERQAFDRLRTVAALKEASVNGWARRVQSDLAVVLHSDTLRRLLPDLFPRSPSSSDLEVKNQIRHYLREYLVHTDRLDEFLVLDPDGKVVLSTFQEHEGDRMDRPVRPADGLSAPEPDQPHLEFIRGPETYASVMAVQPLESLNRSLKGRLIALASLARLSDIMEERTGSGRTGETYLVGPDALLLTDSRLPAHQNAPFVLRSQGVDAALARVSGQGLYANYRGAPVVGVYLWLTDLGVGLVAEQEQAEAFAPIRSTITAILVVGVAALLLALGAAVFIHRDIVTPMSDMVELAKGIAEGNIRATAQVAREDEIGTLARAFNLMTANLARRISLDELIGAMSRRFIALECGAMDQALAKGLADLSQIIGADRAELYLSPEPGALPVMAQEWNRIGSGLGPAGFGCAELTGGAWLGPNQDRTMTLFVPDVEKLPEDAAGWRKKWLAGGVRAVVALPLVSKDQGRGCLLFHSARAQNLWTEKDLRIMGIFGEIISNSLERREAEEVMRASEERYRTIVDYTYDWESWIGPSGEILYAGPSCERITGYPPLFFLRDPAFIHRLIHQEDLPLWKDYMSDETRVEGDSIDFRIFRRDGRMRWLSQVSRKVFDQEGKYLGLRVSMRDITDRKYMERQLEYESLHDPLTGLPNRVLCLDRIKRAMDRAKRRDSYYYAVVFMDLDRFKIINDSLGHAFGDWILVETGERLLRAVREIDTVSRFGGDEFILLLEDLILPREAIRIVKRIQAALAEPFVLQDHEMRVTASFGIVLSPTDYKKPEELLQHANIAMHRVKETGRGRMKVFTSHMLEMAIMRLTMESEIRRAIAGDEFFLEFQPIVDLKNRRTVGYETLVRWQHPQRGLIPPAQFVPTAEETGLILDLGAWILRQSCLTLASWRTMSPAAEDLFISVNISGRQFSATDLVDQVTRVLAETALPPKNLKLEITETSIMERAESSVDKLLRLRHLGVTLSVDDFGTGYSSLSYLQRFPLDILKIDLSFVQGIDGSAENLEIVRAIINLAHNLGLKVVAEGIERESQITALMDLGCEFGQGYLYSRPISAEKVVASLVSLPE